MWNIRVEIADIFITFIIYLIFMDSLGSVINRTLIYVKECDHL